MKRHFCTITTKSHLGKTFALCNSILKFNQNASIHVLLIDKNKSEINSSIHFESQVFIYDSFDLNKNALFKEAIRTNYDGRLSQYFCCGYFLIKRTFQKLFIQTMIFFLQEIMNFCSKNLMNTIYC
jgi:hypothetical protein